MRHIINDTTLRDGEQAPGVAFNTKEKLTIAQKLYEAGADELEIGIAAMGERERADIKEILSLELPIRCMGWNRAVLKDLECSLECNLKSLDLSIPTSDILIDAKFGGSKSLVLDSLQKCLEVAKMENIFVIIGGEDSSRADIGFLKEILELGVAYGASRFRYCDTVGILTPIRCYESIKTLLSYELLPIEMHTHNDFGMASANAIAGIEAGALSVNTTVIGLGERAGNASFEQILMSLIHQFSEDRVFDYKAVRSLAKFVSEASKQKISSNAPIIGSKIFSHESGIHSNGVMKNSSSYEPFTPKEVGAKRFFPIGKHSGSATILYHLKNQGIESTKESAWNLIPMIRDIVTDRKKVLNRCELKNLYLSQNQKEIA